MASQKLWKDSYYQVEGKKFMVNSTIELGEDDRPETLSSWTLEYRDGVWVNLQRGPITERFLTHGADGSIGRNTGAELVELYGWEWEV